MNHRHNSFAALLLSVILSASYTTRAQSEVDVVDISRLQVLTPGYGFEKRVERLQTFNAKAYAALGFSWSYSSSFGTSTAFSVDPGLVLGYRYYYNAARRERKGKRTAMNSLNYLSIITDFVYSRSRISGDDYPEPGRRLVSEAGLVWGIQRNYRGRLSLDLNLGLGYFVARVHETDAGGSRHKRMQGQLNTPGRITIGIWLNKRS